MATTGRAPDHRLDDEVGRKFDWSCDVIVDRIGIAVDDGWESANPGSAPDVRRRRPAPTTATPVLRTINVLVTRLRRPS
jgi:hypothetical protein